MNALPAPWPAPTPASRPDAPALDVIFIEGLVGHTVIGIHTSELHQPQPVVVDVQAGVARAHACDTDRIGDTIDYGAVRTRLQRLFAEHHVRLLEALAEQIAHILLDEFRAQWVRVRVAKPRKFDDVQSVGVMIERRRALPRGPVAATTHRVPDLPSHGVLHLLGAGMVPGGR
jgi:7,8-dihydroneopterin aldolase/epimerase/oxygenase